MAKEACVIVGLAHPSQPGRIVEEYLDELSALLQSAGAVVLQRFIQQRPKIDPATFIGRGKAAEIASYCSSHKVRAVVFDDELSPAQVRNLEKVFGLKVMDRANVILDIFASRARTREAKTQVELAQYTYLLPRLTRAWTHLSRQAGGIGTRGVGETQLETDRRVIRKRIARLSKSLERISASRDVQRRRRQDIFEAALVGYTNVGKSSLLNALTEARARVADKLFATLDTTFRRLPLNGFRYDALLIDTVGFIRKLPHHLVASFHSTLEQIAEAALIIHVIDVSHPQFHEHAVTTRQVLNQLGLEDIPVLVLLNKIDRAPEGLLSRAVGLYPEGIPVSAKTGSGMEIVRKAIWKEAERFYRGEVLWIPYSEWPRFLTLRPSLQVLKESYRSEGVEVHLRGRKDAVAAVRSIAGRRST
ncbi:MAG: GTPase HflX [Acidobacteriota bacterium]